MQTLTKTMALGVGLLISGTALAADYYGGWPPYNQQYTPSYSNYTYSYPAYGYNYGYPTYGWYTGTPYPWPQYSWDPSSGPGHPYSKANSNWVPYLGWR